MFYQRLRKICKEKGITVTKMVKDIGLSSANMSNWKNGRLPKTEIAFKIANYLDVSIYDLMGEEKRSISFVHNAKELEDAIDRVVEKFSQTLATENQTKKPLSEDEERLRELYNATADLSDAEISALKAFVAGLKANRKND